VTLTLQVPKHHIVPHKNKLIILKFLNIMAIMYFVDYFDLFHPEGPSTLNIYITCS